MGYSVLQYCLQYWLHYWFTYSSILHILPECKILSAELIALLVYLQQYPVHTAETLPECRIPSAVLMHYWLHPLQYPALCSTLQSAVYCRILSAVLIAVLVSPNTVSNTLQDNVCRNDLLGRAKKIHPFNHLIVLLLFTTWWYWNYLLWVQIINKIKKTKFKQFKASIDY